MKHGPPSHPSKLHFRFTPYIRGLKFIRVRSCVLLFPIFGVRVRCLCFLFQDALSGNSKVMMFVNVSPASYNVTETLCSLNFAKRCRSVKLGQANKNQEAPEVAK